MASYENFDRQYRLAAGPAGKTGFEIGEITESMPEPLHIKFAIQKSDLETQNTGKITIWNLNNKHLDVINKAGCCISLKAGYGNRMALIFAGAVSYASTGIDKADRKTEIEVIDSLVNIRDTYVSISYKGKVSWKTIFDDVAKQMGAAVSYSYNAKFVNINNGFSFVGPAKTILDKGCKCCGLTWSIQNGVVQIKYPSDVMSKRVYVLSPETGMIGTPEKVVVAKDDETGINTMGWDVEYFLNAAINVSDYVKLESSVATGYFGVYSLEITGDNVSGDWLCKARLVELKPTPNVRTSLKLEETKKKTEKKSTNTSKPSKPSTPKPVTFSKGNKVKVKKGARTYTGGGLASFVYTTTYTVIQVNKDRVVIGIRGVVTAAMKASDLIKL